MPSQERRPRTKRVGPQRFRDFCPWLNPAGDPDFGGRLRDGRAVISAVAHVNFQAATRLSFRSPIAVAPGCEPFCAPIFALVTSTRSLFIPRRTTTRACRGLFIRMICTNTTQKRAGGNVSGANFWYRLDKSGEPESFCSRAIPGTRSFRTILK